MASRSARVASQRPSCARHADAYDALISDPVEPWLTSVHGETPQISEFLFEMRPWTREELQHRLSSAGYSHVDVRDGVGRRSPDRLFVTATRST